MTTPSATSHTRKRAPLTKQQKALKARRARQIRFLEAFHVTGTITGACKMSTVARRTHYDWIERDELYAKKFATADLEVTEMLESEAHTRATIGAEKPVFYQGQRVSTIRDKSDLLLIFLLKARRPEKYRERYDATIQHSGGISTVTEDMLKHLSDDKLEELGVALGRVRTLMGVTS